MQRYPILFLTAMRKRPPAPEKKSRAGWPDLGTNKSTEKRGSENREKRFPLPLLCTCYPSFSAFFRAVSMAFMRAMDVYWELAGYSMPSKDWEAQICSARESMAGCMSGYMMMTSALGANIRDWTPAGKAGHFQGIRMIFAVLLPMVTGPAIGAAVIKNGASTYVELGQVKTVPTPGIYLAAAAVLLLTFVPILVLRKKEQ